MQMNVPDSLRSTVHHLVQSYQWQLIDEDALCNQVWQGVANTSSEISWAEQIVQCYAAELYKACGQHEDVERQAQAYTEIYRYLLCNASQRYPYLSAEDLAQEATRLVYEQIDRRHTPAAFFTFAFNKLRQAAKEALRYHKKQSTEDTIELISPEKFIEPEQARSGFEAIYGRERWQMLIEALARLEDHRQRAVIHLKYFDELDDETIGQQLDLTPNYVRVLRNRGLKALRNDQRLQNYHTDDL